MADQKRDPWELETDDDVTTEVTAIQPATLSDAAVEAHEQAIFVLLENSQDPSVRSDFLRLIVTFIDEDLGDIVGMWHRPPTGPHANKIVARFTSSLKAMTDAVIQGNLKILQNKANAESGKAAAQRLSPRRTPRPPASVAQPTPEVEKTLSTIQRLRESMGGK